MVYGEEEGRGVGVDVIGRVGGEAMMEDRWGMRVGSGWYTGEMLYASTCWIENGRRLSQRNDVVVDWF